MYCLLLKRLRNFTSSDVVNSQYIYDEEYGNGITSILMDICEVLADIDNGLLFIFRINDKDFGLDVRTDLAIFLEHFLELTNFIDSQEINSCTIDFYEQGVEEKILIERIEGNLIAIKSGELQTSIEISYLKEIAIFFINDFLSVTKFIYPSVFNNTLFQDWIKTSSVNLKTIFPVPQ